MIFTFLFILFTILLANGFFINGRNLTQFQGYNYSGDVKFDTLFGSIVEVWKITLGDSDLIDLNKGEELPLDTILWYWINAFIMCVLMLNLLIAIMGDTFATRKDSGHQFFIRDKLHMIIENWHIL